MSIRDMSIREAIDSAPMSRLQTLIVTICIVLFTIEGYDILVMAYAASGAAAEWSLTGGQIGALLSSGAVGMALGSAFLAPLADRIGRRPLILGCLVLSLVGMAASSFAVDFTTLGISRVLTCLGVGGLVASLPVLIAEYTPPRRRGTAIALYAAGLPLGGVLAGLTATVILEPFGWRALFVVGAALTLVMVAVVYAVLPESLDFLLLRRPARALDQINRILPRIGQAPLTELPAAPERAPAGVREGIFTGRNGIRTLQLWLAFFLVMAVFYFVTGWTPQLLEQSGFSAQQGVSGGLLLNVGGVAAMLAFSALTVWFGNRALTIASFLCTGVALLVMVAALQGGLIGILITAIAIGGLMNAAAGGLFTLAPDLYPASVRTTAVGWAASAGRLGAIISPLAAGFLLDRGATPAGLFVIFAVPAFLGAAAVFGLVVRGRGATPEPEVTAPEKSAATPD